MKESSTYQAILEEGELRGDTKFRMAEARRILMLQGAKRFGEPDEQTVSALNAIVSLERLEQLAGRIIEVESWRELLT